MVTEMNNVALIATRLIAAKHPEDVFGALGSGEQDARLLAVTKAYRHIVLAVHPDRCTAEPEDTRKLAQDAFAHLTALKSQAEAKVRAGTYGDRKAAPPPVKEAADAPVVITRGKRRYVVGAPMASGDLCDIHACTYADGSDDRRAVFKIARHAAENDLVQNEARILTKLYPKGTPDEKFFRYLPQLIDTFTLRSPARSKARQVNVLAMVDEYVSLAEVLAAYPKGIDFRDAVWMLKRMLSGLGFAHVNGVVHGAVLPPHVLVGPVNHGAKVIDWSYAVEAGERVRAISPAYRTWYAPEVLAKTPPTSATDLYMWAMCAVALMGGDISARTFPATVPRPLASFVGSCLLANPRLRPQDAWDLHKEFDELL
jgi:serine/threonine protein kinase